MHISNKTHEGGKAKINTCILLHMRICLYIKDIIYDNLVFIFTIFHDTERRNMRKGGKNHKRIIMP